MKIKRKNKPEVTVITIVLLCLLQSLAPVAVRCAEKKTAAPQRIISLGPINTENIYLLGAGERLVGNTSYCNRPAAAEKVPKIGSVMQFSVEKIISLRPDIILATGLTRPDLVKKLQNLDLSVVQFRQPVGFAEICQQFIQLGKLLGLEHRAEQMVAEAKKKVDAVKNKTATLIRQKVFLQIGSRPLFGSINSSFTHDFILFAGGKNIIEDQSSGTTSYEKVITLNPDVIIIAMMGSETGIAGEEKKKWQNIPVLHAARTGRIHIINPDLVCSPSPITFANTLQIIAKLIHPETDITSQP